MFLEVSLVSEIANSLFRQLNRIFNFLNGKIDVVAIGQEPLRVFKLFT